MKIVFMGTPQFAVPSLENLYKGKHSIELVITQKDRPRGRGKKVKYSPVKKKALQLGLEVYQPDNINSQESLNILSDISPDLIVVTAFGQILKKSILEIPKYACINVHGSLLPKYRGAAPINWAIINGEKETGITIMEIEEGLDSGDIIEKQAIPILDEDDSASLHDKLAMLGGKLLVKVIDDISQGKAVRTPQNHSRSSYAPMIYKETGKIDWNKKGKEIQNLVRGLRPWPGAYTGYKNERMKIFKLGLTNDCPKGRTGEVISISKNGLYVSAQDSIVVIQELQFPNKRRMAVKEFLAGNDIELGSILE